MFIPSMTLPPDALVGVPLIDPSMSFGDVLAVGPWGFLPVGLAIVLLLLLHVARSATRLHERQPIEARASAVPARDESFSRAA